MNQPPKSRPWAAFRSSEITLALLLLISLSLNYFLSLRMTRLQSEASLLKAALSGLASEAHLQPGDLVPPLQALGLNGQAVTVEYGADQPATVLYYFSPTCGWCQRNLDNIRALAHSLGKSYRLYGLSKSSRDLSSYVKQHQLDFPILTEVSLPSGESYKLGGTPGTIVVGSDGKVVKVWRGAYSDRIQKEVEDFFAVRLPGLVEPD